MSEETQTENVEMSLEYIGFQLMGQSLKDVGFILKKWSREPASRGFSNNYSFIHYRGALVGCMFITGNSITEKPVICKCAAEDCRYTRNACWTVGHGITFDMDICNPHCCDIRSPAIVDITTQLLEIVACDEYREGCPGWKT